METVWMRVNAWQGKGGDGAPVIHQHKATIQLRYCTKPDGNRRRAQKGDRFSLAYRSDCLEDRGPKQVEENRGSHTLMVGSHDERKDHNVSAQVGLPETQSVWEPPPAKALDEAVWQAWIAKGRIQDRHDSAARMTAVKWISIAGLLAAAGLWSSLPPYDVAVRFLVAIGALALTFHAFVTHRYAFAGLFGALALLYNPAMPVFGLSGNWQHALVVASTIPFAVSLTWRNRWKAK